MAFKNPGFIGYVERSYEQSKSRIVTRFQYLIPEMTDHTESNPFIKMVSIWCGILEQLNFYIDSKAREVYLLTLKRFSSAVKIARSYDYRVKGTSPASVNLRFYLSQPAPSVIAIPAGTEVKTKDGISFFTTTLSYILVGQLEVIVPAIQQTFMSGVVIGTGTGTINEKFLLEENVVSDSIQITINSVVYTSIESFIFAESTDNVFVSTVNEDGVMQVEFGDGVNGSLAAGGNDVIADYYISEGSAGNQAENNVTELISSITVPSGYVLQVTNLERSSGGVDTESISDISRRVPKFNRTNDRAVSDQDYIDIAEMVNGVARGGLKFNCGKTVDVYVVPNGGGVASISLLRAVRNYFEGRRMTTTKVNVYSAGDVRIVYEVNLKVLRNYIRANVVQAVTDNLVAFHDPSVQEIKGTVAIGDIYQIIENTPGVDNSEVIKMTVIPYAIPVGAAPVLLWDREILPASTQTVSWRIKMIDSTKYQLYKQNSFLGVFDVNTEYSVQGILKLKVLPYSYSTSNSWNFNTYKYFGTLEIADMSIPSSFAENITINATGGL